MPNQEGYEVIRFVKQGSECQPVMDYARGEIFAQWLKSHPVVKKEEMFYMMRELMMQLIRLHQSADEKSYPYVTPYSVCLSESKEVLLLDFHAKSNEVIERQMKRRAIRNNFFPKMQGVKPLEEEKNEIYSLGRTMQFLLTVQEPEPPLGKVEELRLRRIIAKCLGESRERQYEHIEEILKQFPKCRKMNPEFPQILKKFTVSAGLLFLVLVSGSGIVLKKVVPAMHQKPEAAKVKKQDVAAEKSKKEMTLAEDSKYSELCLDMGLLHFLKLEDYKKSKEYFEKAEGMQTAESYGNLARFMDTQEMGDAELSQSLSDAVTALSGQSDVRFAQCILKVYGKIEERKGGLLKEQYLTMALAAELGMEMPEWKEQDQNHETEKELLMYQARGYEGGEELEKAQAAYLKYLDLEMDAGRRVEICEKLAGMYEKEGKMEEARDVCRKEMELNADSKNLRILYIRLQCQDPGIERTVCADTIKEFLDLMPELASEEAFQKIQEEYEIAIDNGTVSVGK